MIQDFAKLRARPAEEDAPAAAPPAWSLVLTGAVAGAAAAVFLCAILYMSGLIPPPAAAVQPAAAVPPERAAVADADPGDAERDDEFDFYTALPAYEVRVDAVPVDLASQDPERALDTPYTLQAGAFQQRRLAEAEAIRQRALGLDARVAESRAPTGRVLYLVRSGPYATVGELDRAETILRRNGIRNLRLGVR